MLGIGRMHENIYIYIYPGILNTRFVFLQYKNTKTNTCTLPGHCSSELNFT